MESIDGRFEIEEIYEKLSDANKDKLLLISEKLCQLRQCEKQYSPNLAAAVQELNDAIYGGAH